MNPFRRRARRPASGDAPAAASSRARERRDPGAYDRIAEAFEAGDARHTLVVARDLVAALELRGGERVLDVGTGTGVVLDALRERHADAFGVGADVALGMLRVGMARGRIGRPVAAAALDLPFGDQTFDAVTANFVLSHFARLDTALFDLRRVLRVGGRLGATAWASSTDEFERAWNEVAERYAAPALLREARNRVVPSEEVVSDPDRLRDRLYADGFRKLRVERRRYRFDWDREAFLANRNEIRGARYMRNLLGEALWTRFQQDVAAVYRERFPDRFGDTVEVLIATGTRED